MDRRGEWDRVLSSRWCSKTSMFLPGRISPHQIDAFLVGISSLEACDTIFRAIHGSVGFLLVLDFNQFEDLFLRFQSSATLLPN